MTTAPVVVALGGNALSGDDREMNYPQLGPACEALAASAEDGLVVTHGNGPQIGLLAQGSSRPLDLLGAETEGLLGYRIEQELGNRLAPGRTVASLLTRVEVAADDPGFDQPSKPVGAWLTEDAARRLRRDHGWRFIERDGRFRRVVPSPKPQSMVQLGPIRTLLAAGTVVICTGGGGIPVVRDADGRLQGVGAVIDKDRASALLATQLNASLLVLATDVDGVYRDWDGARQDRIADSDPASIRDLPLPPGSMGPKVEAACDFAEASGRCAVIGALTDLEHLLAGKAGTRIQQRR